MYNVLKFKNQGFKFWVEYPTVWGNNFIQVRSVTKRRNWLTWVDFDPYEDRELVQPMPISPPKVEKPPVKVAPPPKEKEKNDKAADHTPVKKGKKYKKQQLLEAEKADKSPKPVVEEEEKQILQRPDPISLPNLIFTQIRRIKIIKDLLPHQIYNHIDGIN